MDQHTNNSQNEFLWALLANPANDAHLHTYNLQRLVNDFPQSGILQALLAHASDDKNLKKASVYFNSWSLYKLINNPSAFIGVPDDRIVIQPNIVTNGYQHFNDDVPAVESFERVHDLSLDTERNDTAFNAQPTIETVVEDHIQAEAHHSAVGHENNAPFSETISEEHLVEPLMAGIADSSPAKHHIEEITTEAHTHLHQPEIDESISVQENLEEKHTHLHETETADSSSVEENLEEDAAEAHTYLPSHEVLDNTSVEEHIENVSTAAHTDLHRAEITDSNFNKAHIENIIEEAHTALHEPEAIDSLPVEHHFENIIEEANAALAEHEAVKVEDTVGHTHMPALSENAGSGYEVADEGHHQPVEAAKEEDSAQQAEANPIINDAAVDTHEKEPEKDIEEETFDEIVSIEDINLEEERLIKGAAVGTDYFMFDRAFGEHKEATLVEYEAPVAAVTAENTPEAETSATDNIEHQDISKYHDEKMPYSFMWWLDKTRKEHAGIFQPYIKPETDNSNEGKAKSQGDPLQQQYYENIFHITSVEELDKSTAPKAFEFGTKRKESGIIERFIQEEPTIKPQSSDKIDNENKAKKSSEDRDELVTETLAGIYSDQMLYHKAIASYKKLMLKFPEKSRYFAGKIEQLEKKTN